MAIDKRATQKQSDNEHALKIYAAFLAGLIVVSVCVSRYQASGSASGRWLRRSRRRLERRTPWLWARRPSVGLVVLTTVYLAGNAAIASNFLSSTRLNYIGSRCGWLTAANMTLCVFFALRNTPLSLVVPASHVELNVFHRLTGIVAIFFVVSHAGFYTASLTETGRLEKFASVGDMAAILAGISMLVLLMGLFRHRNYDMFYVSHVLGFVAAVALAVVHRPLWFKKLPQVMMVTFGLWLADRAIRSAGALCGIFTTQATCHPLPGGGTQVILKRSFLCSAVPGSHCFLWIPRISLFHSHPMTIVDNGAQGLELVIKSHRGFTRKLGDLAREHPGARLWAFTGLSYGSSPDVSGYDELVLVSGGSGASFVFGFVNRILSRPRFMGFSKISCALSFQQHAHLSWYRQHVDNLQNLATVTSISLHVTREAGPVPAPSDHGAQPVQGAGGTSRPCPHTSPQMGGPAAELAIEQPPSGELTSCTESVVFGRINMHDLLGRLADDGARPRRALVVACGPEVLMDDLKESVDRHRATDPSCVIDLYCGDFGGC
ncbi:Ferric reductase NAD binding domain [Geosmithia morbida]|uniref:Ferric reductase NAD binding domain n=1 Tax=Geosmithia morbida TaxID=1094350 RepID=A0A9P4YQX6_9HYPO|nr:Ferric reductase NAD binding domain [Geosmithia morbida]KAF4121478.1 Ferric reductase NAD binding domain [Geosmithia morbida]